ncbi:MAG: condensation domain-containing protein, partial [Caulobacteraceae bacterium]
EGLPRLVAQPVPRLTLPLIDLCGLPPERREDAARRIAEDDARQPFDLAKAPLLRAKVVRLAPDSHRLLLTLHHIVFDGVSIYRILMPELTELYAAFARGGPPPPAPLRVQYADYALWRSDRLETDRLRRELDYWRAKLADAPTLNLPSDRPRPASPSHRGAMETFALTPELTDALKGLSARQGVTLYVTLLAAFKAMLHRYTGQDDIVIGAVTDTRRRPELENVIGYFLNSLALRSRPTGETRFRDYLREVQATVVDALDASNVPFDRIVRELRVQRHGARHPLFQVLFSIEPPAPPFADGWDLTQMDVAVTTAKFDLYLELDERDDRLIGRFLYSADLFDAATIRRMIGHWTTLLGGAVADPQCALARLPLLTAAEQREILEHRNHTACAYPRVTLHGWVEEAARRTPDAIAVTCQDQRLTYAELRRRVRGLAADLRTAGVRRGDVVGLAVERSCDMVAGLLAILRCGAAYLPLDPALPSARLK